jgi:hypothetical protein
MDLAFDMVNEENREDFVALYASPNDDLARIFQEFWGRYLPVGCHFIFPYYKDTDGIGLEY